MLLMMTIPTSSSLVNRSRSPAPPVETLAPRPKRVSLAKWISCSISVTRNNEATGPKNSSR